MIANLRSQHLPAYDRKLELFYEMSRSHLGIPVTFTPELAFRFLACRVLYVRFRCSRPSCNYRWQQPWQFCNMRFLCDGCAAWSRWVQGECWKNGINAVLAGGRVLSQLLELEWDLPRTTGPQHISGFSRYLSWVVQPRLTRAMPDSGVGWLMATAFDPARGEMRAILGVTSPEQEPEKGTASCCNAVDCFRGEPLVVAVGERVVRQQLAVEWLPRTVEPAQPGQVGQSIEWLAGSLAEVAPRRAIELESRFYKRRLYTSRGLLYGLASRKARHHEVADIQIGRLDSEGMPKRLPPLNRPGEKCVCPDCGWHLRSWYVPVLPAG
jgi:hypothetical protein